MRDCIRGSFVKGVANLLLLLLDRIEAPSELIDHPQFDYIMMLRLAPLQTKILQYPPELQSIMDNVHTTNGTELELMVQLSDNNESAGSG